MQRHFIFVIFFVNFIYVFLLKS